MTAEEIKLFDKFSEIAFSHFLKTHKVEDAEEFRICEFAACAYGIAESMIIRRRLMLKVGIEDMEKVN